MRPLILLSNDDGIAAPNLHAMREALAEHADVVVCAPELNQSASSHALSLSRILRLRSVGDGMFALDGTPADCVYVALYGGDRLLPRRPDVVVSGMNHGPNLGTDVFYSGTVAAAREAAIRGIASIAVSADTTADARAAAALGAKLALALVTVRAGKTTSPAPLLNVNIPPGTSWPVRVTCLGARLYEEEVEYRKDPRGREYLWLGGGGPPKHGFVKGSDTEAHDEGVASITPLTLDLREPSHDALALAVAEQP